MRFLNKAFKHHGNAEKVVTDDLKSYPAAMIELGNLELQEVGRWKNNRAGELALTDPTTRAGTAAFSTDEEPIEIWFGPRQRPQSL
ncbi:hypothetical protein GRI43_01310 [Altererythrobacter luteolus]|uniref:DDE domain-containing protein n=1 Tax=Pontixanthobacter luteolus TaxID=295089 RepID=A0A6I4UZP4_9SPHN|nr:hypothetical protein [Pontixanthobacter luteolus]MXP46030.1 hypothetical protein [Pontixanthobacter luteolus]